MNLRHTIQSSSPQPSGRLRTYVRTHLWDRIPSKSGFALSALTITLGATAAGVAATQSTNISTPTIHSNISSQSTVDSGNTTEDNPAQDVQSASTNVTSDGTTVSVNGETITVPENGSVHKTISGPNGSTTTVNVTNSQTSGGSATNSSSVNFSSTSTVHSSSSSSSATQTNNQTEFSSQ